MATLLSSTICLLLLVAANGQFFYNYEDDRSSDLPSESESYDPSQYRYNPPSATNQQFLRPVVQNVQVPRQRPVAPRRTQGRSVSRVVYEPETMTMMEPEPEVKVITENQREPEIAPEQRMDHREVTRNTRMRTRLRYNFNNEPAVSTPRVYSPSAFQNIELGQAPTGVFIPQNSFLNVLKNPGYRSQAITPYSSSYQPPYQPQSQPIRPQPVVSYNNNDWPQFFVQPPSREEPKQQQNEPAPVIDDEQNQQYITPIATRYVPPVSNRHVSSTSSRNVPPTSNRRTNRNRRVNAQTQTSDMQAQPVQSSRRQRQRTVTQPQYRYGAEEQSVPVNNIDDYDNVEDDIVRYRPPVQPQRRQNEPRNSVQRSNSQSQSAAPQRRQQPTFKPAKLAIAELPEDTDEDGIPGQAGVDYPTLHVIPNTAFSCSQQQHNGYYADLETSCQVVHLCQSRGVKNSFLCPNGTIFSQEKFACQWWYKVNCADSPRYYGINDSLYKVPTPPTRSRN